MFYVRVDSFSSKDTRADEAYSKIAISKKFDQTSLSEAAEGMEFIIDPNSLDLVDASDFGHAWIEIIIHANKMAVNGRKFFLEVEYDMIRDACLIELQCEATFPEITSAFKLKNPERENAISFVIFSLTKSKHLKLLQLPFNPIVAI
jgi:hypothetical protein